VFKGSKLYKNLRTKAPQILKNFFKTNANNAQKRRKRRDVLNKLNGAVGIKPKKGGGEAKEF
jgi:hypothetical protein